MPQKRAQQLVAQERLYLVPAEGTGLTPSLPGEKEEGAVQAVGTICDKRFRGPKRA